MMTRKNGISIDIPHLRSKKLVKVINKYTLLDERWYNNNNGFVELGHVNIIGATVVVPFDSPDYNKSIAEGYTLELDRWKNTN